MIKHSIPLVFVIYAVQMLVGTNAYLFLMPRMSSLACLVTVSIYTPLSHYLVEILVFPPAIRRKMVGAFATSGSTRPNKRFHVAVWFPLLLEWIFLIYLTCFDPTFNTALPINFSTFAWLNIIISTNFVSIIYGCLVAFLRLEQVSHSLYSSGQQD